VQGRHRLQTSDALGAAAAQLGPDAQAAIVELNKQGGLSHGKVTRCLQSLFGIRLSQGGSVHTVLRAAARCEPVYEAICQTVGQSDWVVPDETGWRVGGHPAWLHALVGPQATAYVIDPTRSGAVAEAILGLDYDGTMIHDGWSPYDQFKDARHQQCVQHTIRTQSLGFSSQRRFVQPRSLRGPVRQRRWQDLRLRPAQWDHVADLQRVLPYDDALDE
jgi:transposase